MKIEMTDEELYNWVFKIADTFYDLVYKDVWFKKIFRNIEQDSITAQQTDFMVQNMGGPKRFSGRDAKDAHPQIWIDENIWNYREDLLKKAFKEVNAPAEICELWLKIDNAFKLSIINKGGVEECVGRFKTDEIIYEPMPDYLKK